MLFLYLCDDVNSVKIYLELLIKGFLYCLSKASKICPRLSGSLPSVFPPPHMASFASVGFPQAPQNRMFATKSLPSSKLKLIDDWMNPSCNGFFKRFCSGVSSEPANTFNDSSQCPRCHSSELSVAFSDVMMLVWISFVLEIADLSLLRDLLFLNNSPFQTHNRLWGSIPEARTDSCVMNCSAWCLSNVSSHAPLGSKIKYKFCILNTLSKFNFVHFNHIKTHFYDVYHKALSWMMIVYPCLTHDDVSISSLPTFFLQLYFCAGFVALLWPSGLYVILPTQTHT